MFGRAIVVFLIVSCLVVLAGQDQASATTWSLTAPTPDTKFFTDERITFDWDVSDYAIEWWLEVVDSSGKLDVRRHEDISIDFVEGSQLEEGDYTWRVCSDHFGVSGVCTGYWPFEMIKAPVINGRIARIQIRTRLKHKWKAMWTKINCVDDGQAYYNCNMRWRSKRISYTGTGSVYLSDHKYVISTYVYTRKRR